MLRHTVRWRATHSFHFRKRYQRICFGQLYPQRIWSRKRFIRYSIHRTFTQPSYHERGQNDFGRPAVLRQRPQQYRPTFVIKAVSFFGNDIGGINYRDSKDITGTLPELFEKGMSFLKANLHNIQAGQGFNSIGKLEISEVALEEILQNALVHRDYTRNAPIRLLILITV